jgi:CheY-like chemotaxis protein
MRSVRVLLAEDDEDHVFLTVRALRDMEGIRLEVDSVRDGREALDYLNRRGRFADQPRPHLILLDLKMPRIGGLEVLDEVKRDAELRSIPVVVLTSSERQEDIDEAYRRGSNSYVVKSANHTGMREGLRRLGDYWTAVASLPRPPEEQG